MHKNTDESQIYQAKWKMPDTKGCILHNFIVTLKKSKTYWTANRLTGVTARRQGQIQLKEATEFWEEAEF